MARPKRKRHTNPDFRHRVSVPLPPVEEIEEQLWTLLSPSFLAPRLMERRDPRKADRVIRM